ncbi:MAG: hypothetical protein M3Y09_17630 [Actinomycetota bacterium]|nr:hypothetical protein [Actinomycetota bacterium]
MSRRLIIILVVTLAAVAGAAGALAAALHIQTASAGGVTAAFSFRGAIPAITGPHLKIIKGGQTAYDAPVTSRACGTMCGPLQVGGHATSVGIVPLLPGSPEVVLELYSGGANCCVVDQIFRYDPSTMTYVKTEHNFASAGALLKRLHGRWRFLSADDGFKYAFTDGADSGEPIQIWSYGAARFTDVTRSYPGLIRTDAARWLRLFNHHVDNGVGLIAAWAGDEELLGRDGLVQSTLKTELARGRLRGGAGNFFAGGAKFIRELNRVLRQLGYKH